MDQQNTSNAIWQRRHSGMKPYIVIAVTVGLLCVLQAVLNISLRLSLNASSSSCSGETEKIFRNVTIEEELKNMTNERDELKQKLEQHGMQLTRLKGEKDELQTKLILYGMQLTSLGRAKDGLQTKLNLCGIQLTSLGREKDGLQTKLNLCDRYLKENWTYFSGSYYYISTNKTSWQSSRNDCLGRGADLIIIDSREENEFAGTFKKVLWIGLSDGQNEGNWIWPDGSPLRKSFWHTGEPNSYQDRDEDCVEIMNFDTENSWNDVSCTEANFWICEKKTGV